MTYLYRWIQNMAVFFVMTVLITRLLPNRSYEKYIRLFLGLLLMMVLLQPLENLFSLDEFFLSAFEEGILTIESDEISEEIEALEVSRMENLLLAGTKKIKEELKESLAEIGYEINQIRIEEADSGDAIFSSEGDGKEDSTVLYDFLSSGSGNYVLTFYVSHLKNGGSAAQKGGETADAQGEDEGEEPWTVKIPVISIFREDGGQEEPAKEEASETSEDASEVKNLISGFYELSGDNINVVIQN